jgi:Caspase domain/Putative peptidoglycan binding domain
MRRTALFAAAISLALFCTPVWSDSAYAQKRVALVIGNSGYRNVPFLPNPIKDAKAMVAKFQEAGFAVVKANYDVGYLGFKRAIREFEDAAADADITVVFYAGHGIEVDGVNYMIPVDAKLVTTRDAQDEAITLDRLLEAAEGAKQLSLVILDSCRDNPFVHMKPKRTAALSRAVTVKPGMNVVEPTNSNTLIYYAARKGSGAEDGDGEHSPFTSALLRHLFVPGQDIRFAFGKVRDDVLRQTGNKQEPFVTGSFGSTLVALAPAPEAPTLSTADTKLKPDVKSEQVEKEHYEFVKEVGSAKAWKVFLLQHPNGFYSDLARAQLDKAEKQEKEKLAAVEPDKLPLVPTPTTEEQRAWDRIKDSGNAAWLRDFIKRYPTSPLATSAQTRLDAIEQQAREREEKARQEREAKAAEEARQKAERAEALRRAEEERKAKAAEEARLKAEREAALKREAEERLAKLAAEEARKKAEREVARKREEAERQAKAAEEARLKAEREAALKREEEERRVKAAVEAERARVEREAALKRAEEERQVKAAEAARLKAEHEAALKREEEEQRAKAAAEAERQKIEREAALKRQEEERQAKAAEAARQKAERDAALKREEEEQRATAATEAEKLRVEREAALRRQEEERQAKAEEAARLKAEHEAALKQAGEERAAKAAVEAERQRIEREAALKRAEEERQAKAAEATRLKAEREAALKRAEEERAAKAAVETERQRIEREATLKRQVEERQAKAAEAARLKAEHEAALKRAEEERAAKAAAEAERQKIEREAALKRAEEERAAKAAEAERLKVEREAALKRAEEERKAKIELVRQAQTELARIGCFGGDADGNLNVATKAAIKKYQAQRGRPASNAEITDSLVSDLRGQSARICPLTCPTGQVAEGEHCVAAQPPAIVPAPVVRHNVEPEEKPRRERAKQEEPRTRPVAHQRDNDERPSRRERAREEPRRERASREESRPRVRQEASTPRYSGGGGGGGGGGHGPIGVGF